MKLEFGLTVGLTGRQGMLTPPRHLIPPLLCPGVHVSLIFTVDCSIYLHWKPILTVDFSVYLTERTDFDCGLFCLPNLDTLILTTDLYVWNGAQMGATGQQGMFTPPRHLISPLVYPEVRVCPILKFVFPTGLMRLMTICYSCYFICCLCTKSSIDLWSL
jgi:hypothetical protein